MKKISVLFIALALVFGLSQCKKQVDTIANNVVTNGETISLYLDGGNDGSKVGVDGEGHVTFGDGDKLLVASGSCYVGTLTWLKYTETGSVFSGDISGATTDQPLRFYFLGNKDTGTLTAGTSTYCTVSITDQTSSLPVISAGVSTKNYIGPGSYNVELFNKCALVKFNVTNNDADGIVTPIYVDNSSVTVNFGTALVPGGTEGFTYLKGEGRINLAAGTGERWAIVFPQEGKTTRTIHKFYNGDNIISVNQAPTHAIAINDLQSDGYDVYISDVYFTTNASAGTKAYFAPGNLQWSPQSGGIWRIAEHQYDMIGDGTIGNVLGSGNQHINDPEYNGWIDQFGYGTSGWSDGDAIAYQPNSISTSSNDYIKHSFTEDYANADWGVYNEIYNPNRGRNDAAGTWRTPTIDEYKNVVGKDASNPRTGANRYAKAKVGDIFGMIIIPDNWVSATYSLSNIDDSKANYTSNVITYADWDNYLEPSGCVFLPGAGYREGATNLKYLSTEPSNVNGYYWTSDYYGYVDKDKCFAAYRWNFYNNGIGAVNDRAIEYFGKTHAGRPVRLIRNR